MVVPGQGLPKSLPSAFVHVFLPLTLPLHIPHMPPTTSPPLLGSSLWQSVPPQRKLLRKAHLRLLAAAFSSLCQGPGRLLGPVGGWSPRAPEL